MKIICVAGGSYKSFYINSFCKLAKCDLLVFNYGIIYNYDIKEELLGIALVTKELLYLSKKLHCTVVAGVYQVRANQKIKSIIFTDGDKIHLTNVQTGAHIHIKNYSFVVGDENTNYGNQHKIILSNKRIEPVLAHCSNNKIYIFCDKFGVNFVKNRKLTRKFNKIVKIYLK